MRVRLLFCVLITASMTLDCSQWSDKLDLSRLLKSPEALNGLVIRYQASRTEVLYVYGSGKVVKQTVDPKISDSLVPTCTGHIDSERIRNLIQFLVERHFFALPFNTYYYATASDEDDYWSAVQVHSIILDDSISRAQRDFASGVWLEKQQTLPEDFVAVEDKLRAIQETAIENKPCRLSPGIRLPAAQRPMVAPQNPTTISVSTL
jgi:hypothetical protein